MTEKQLLPTMVQISNNSRLTQAVTKAIAEKLNKEELNDLLMWINKIVKPRIT